jgi:hypothetical protein
MDKLTRFSVIGIIISIALIIFKQATYSKILASLGLGVFAFMLIYHNYKKNKSTS